MMRQVTLALAIRLTSVSNVLSLLNKLPKCLKLSTASIAIRRTCSFRSAALNSAVLLTIRILVWLVLTVVMIWISTCLRSLLGHEAQVTATQVSSVWTSLFWAALLRWLDLSWASDRRASRLSLGFPRKFWPTTRPYNLNCGMLWSSNLQPSDHIT